MATPSAGKVARARIVPPPQPSLLDESPDVQLRRVLIPGASTERYGRLWRLGQVHEEDGYLYGRIGFEAATGADLWKEERLDFEPTEVPGGVAAPFAVRLSDLAVVFQTRSQDIRVTSFTGALRGILRESTDGALWDVVAVRSRRTFQNWRQSVEIVTRLRFQLNRPNPNYEGRPEVERIIESLRLTKATLDLHSDEGIATDEDLARQMLAHVERGYGQGVAVGERDEDGQRVETVWTTELQGETLISTAPADPLTKEVSPESLRLELAKVIDIEEAT